MTKNEFIIGDPYLYKGNANAMTYMGETLSEDLGMFESRNTTQYYAYSIMTPCTQSQYPNPPLPHCKERIAFAKGANIEYRLLTQGIWHNCATPQWLPGLKYRVKVEKTNDDLRIEELEENIRAHENCVKQYKKELADLKPTSHY
jgi:hypothetical protein